MYDNPIENIAFIKSSFRKRIFIVFLVIIIAFTSSFKPKEVKAVIPVVAGILGVAAAITTVTGAIIGTKTIIDWFTDNKGMNEDEVVDYFNENISIDGDGNYTFTDDAQLTINQMLSDYNDSVTMVYRYPVNVNNISAVDFPNVALYNAVKDFCVEYPDCYFRFRPQGLNGSQPSGLSGCTVIHPDGSTETVSGSFYILQMFYKPYCAVNSNCDNGVANCTLYNDVWETCPVKSIAINCTSSSEYSFYFLNSMSYGNMFLSNDTDIKDVPNNVLNTYNNNFPLFLRSDISCSYDFNDLYCGGSSAINCYKSVADMKKDFNSQTVGSYTPDYTGSPNFNITQTDIDNCVNNYYPSDPDDDPGGGSGSGSGSDDSGGSGSGGSGIIDGLGKLFGAIGNIIDKLFGFVLGLLSKVVDFFGSILEMFTDTLTKLIDIVPAGFNQFLAAMFPYIPEEWITIAEFILLVSAIGCVVALFKK